MIQRQPEYSDLFVMKDPQTSSPIRLNFYQPIPEHDWISAVYRGEIKPDEPLTFIQGAGRLAYDILWATYLPLFVISLELQNILKSYGYTGWVVYSVNVFAKRKTLLSGYSGFAVTGRVGEQDLKRGEVVTKSPRRTGGKPYEVLRGNFFNDDFWDGNDFCLSGYGGYPIVTKRVVDTLKKKRIENVRFVPVSEDEVGLDILKLAGQWPLGSKKDG